MFLPHPVIEQLDEVQVAAWEQHFAGMTHERPRATEEGIWRRTQEAANAGQSGWNEGENGRRRIVHYRYRYDLDYTFPVPRLVLADLYLYHSVLAPDDEIEAYRGQIDAWLEQGRWRMKTGGTWAKGDLRAGIAEYGEHPQDERAGRDTPAGFRSVDIVIVSDEFEVPRTVRQLPWNVLAGGMRVKEQRGTPSVAENLSGLLEYLPFMVEIGCGSSIEAGVPPLHFLHEVYRVTERRDNAPTRSHRFTMRPGDDTLVEEMLTDPAAKADQLMAMFKAAFEARPTSAHRILKELHGTGRLVGPVIQHNFDLLAARAGLPECFVRRYDQKIPPVPFHPEAKALLVVGLHADRRAVQARARARGLKVFFVDPEGLVEDGVFREYPIEGAREGDVVVRTGAIEALTRLKELLHEHDRSAAALTF
ncbi:hypothetical protein [Streptomyces qinzhouensis]|uniref:Uncharacterized protein n=1 Tax=Streptomyces qinzhouensis TaxID=2599401 RepID=A0A5B8IQK1_9ACTN|nr:hypothetical protein [Streptomyces qinzhouensis]QDY79889.1 hypothetical protein FQU76_28880 [Streptomyces qinzhouensis]